MIPTSSRAAVRKRDLGLCARCSGRGTDWHHRRSRRVVGPHRHCPCNGLLLCRDCHAWAHAHVIAARADGYVVTQWQEVPGDVPHRRQDGWWMSACDGGLVPVRSALITFEENGAPVSGP